MTSSVSPDLVAIFDIIRLLLKLKISVLICDSEKEIADNEDSCGPLSGASSSHPLEPNSLLVAKGSFRARPPLLP